MVTAAFFLLHTSLILAKAFILKWGDKITKISKVKASFAELVVTLLFTPSTSLSSEICSLAASKSCAPTFFSLQEFLQFRSYLCFFQLSSLLWVPLFFSFEVPPISSLCSSLLSVFFLLVGLFLSLARVKGSETQLLICYWLEKIFCCLCSRWAGWKCHCFTVLSPTSLEGSENRRETVASAATFASSGTLLEGWSLPSMLPFEVEGKSGHSNACKPPQIEFTCIMISYVCVDRIVTIPALSFTRAFPQVHLLQ